VQVQALVWPPAEPLCTHPGGYPTPNTLPTASTSTVPQQGKAGVQVLALVPPPAEPLCAHPGSYPTPSTAFHFVHKNVCLTLSVYQSSSGSEPPQTPNWTERTVQVGSGSGLGISLNWTDNLVRGLGKLAPEPN
jgi:hypothetical protein